MADGLSKGVERDDWESEQNSDPRSSEPRCHGRWFEFQDKLKPPNFPQRFFELTDLANNQLG